MVTLLLRGRHRRLRAAPQRSQGPAATRRIIAFRVRGHRRSGWRPTSRLQWNSGYAESVYTFANTINTTEGGTHEEGFRAALTTTVNKFAREWGVLKEKDANLTGDDVREGLTAIVSVKLGEPQFEGQTKTKLGNTEAKTFVQKVCNEKLGEWFEQNPAEGKEIARKAVAASTARIAARKARDLARNRKGLLESGGAARQARRLPVDRPGQVRALHRRGRLGRRLGQGRARLRGSRRSCRSAARS